MKWFAAVSAVLLLCMLVPLTPSAEAVDVTATITMNERTVDLELETFEEDGAVYGNITITITNADKNFKHIELDLKTWDESGLWSEHISPSSKVVTETETIPFTITFKVDMYDSNGTTNDIYVDASWIIIKYIQKGSAETGDAEARSTRVRVKRENWVDHGETSQGEPTYTEPEGEDIAASVLINGIPILILLIAVIALIVWRVRSRKRKDP